MTVAAIGAVAAVGVVAAGATYGISQMNKPGVAQQNSINQIYTPTVQEIQAGTAPAFSSYVNAPSLAPQAALVNGDGQLGAQMLANQGNMLNSEAQIAPQQNNPDIWGGGGAEQSATAAANYNAFQSQKLENQYSPATAALRQALPKALGADLSNDYMKTLTPELMSQLFSSGANTNSTVGQSAYLDSASAASQALRKQAESASQSYLAQNQAPVAGLDPGAVASAKMQANAQNTAQNNALVQNVAAGANNLGTSAADYVNNLMGQTSQAVGSDQANWQNYQQAMYNSAMQGYNTQLQVNAQNAGTFNQASGQMANAQNQVMGENTSIANNIAAQNMAAANLQKAQLAQMETSMVGSVAGAATGAMGGGGMGGIGSMASPTAAGNTSFNGGPQPLSSGGYATAAAANQAYAGDNGVNYNQLMQLPNGGGFTASGAFNQ